MHPLDASDSHPIFYTRPKISSHHEVVYISLPLFIVLQPTPVVNLLQIVQIYTQPPDVLQTLAHSVPSLNKIRQISTVLQCSSFFFL